MTGHWEKDGVERRNKMICDDCIHNRTGSQRIIVDNKTADEWEEWGCEVEGKLTSELMENIDKAKECPYYEHDSDLDDPCYGCPGSPDYCDECTNKEQE